MRHSTELSWDHENDGIWLRQDCRDVDSIVHGDLKAKNVANSTQCPNENDDVRT